MTNEQQMASITTNAAEAMTEAMTETSARGTKKLFVETNFKDITTDHYVSATCESHQNMLTVVINKVYTITMPSTITQLSEYHGLIIQCRDDYYYMSHPLNQLITLDIQGRIVSTLAQLSMLATWQSSKLHIWSTVIAEERVEFNKLITLDVHHHHPNVFYAHDLSGTPVICVTSAACLTGLLPRFEDGAVITLTPSFKIRDVRDAKPVKWIRAHQNCFDIMVSSCNNDVSLYAGRNRLCSVSREEHALLHVVFVNPLIRDCLGAISIVLYVNNNSRRLACLYQELIKARCGADVSRDEWDVFKRTILNMFNSDYYSQQDVDGELGDCWSYVLSCKYHHKHGHKRRLRHNKSNHSTLVSIKSRTGHAMTHNNNTLQQIFNALHLLYQDYKLDSLKRHFLTPLITLCAQIANTLNYHSYLRYYHNEYPQLIKLDRDHDDDRQQQQLLQVPCIIETLIHRIQHNHHQTSYPLPTTNQSKVFATWRQTTPFVLSQQVSHYYDILYRDNHHDILLPQMIADNFTKHQLDRLPFSISQPLKNALFKLRVHPNSTIPNSLELLNRHDLLQIDQQSNHQDTITALLRLHSFAAPHHHSHNSPTAIRFSQDRRLSQVITILSSTKPTILSPIPTSSDTQHVDLTAHLKERLRLLLMKPLATPPGRGAFMLRTLRPTDPTKPLHIPPLCLTGKIFGQKGTNLTLSETFQWPQFHNGVAAGLEIVASSFGNDHQVGHILSRSWIINHHDNTSEHAGMLLACGLAGYLPALKKTDYYQYLLSRHDLTSVGLMLGLSCCNIGSMDDKISKMLCLHVRAFNVAGFSVPDFHVSVNVQTAATLGLGLLYKSSIEIAVVQGLLKELTYKPKPGDVINNRESLALAAGLAIGLVCLGRGSVINAAERELTDTLVILANGGLSKSAEPSHHHDTHYSDVDGLHSTLPESEMSTIDEGGKINTDIATPAALLALALIYVKTNDETLRQRIQLPNTLYSLDRLKPLHVYLVVLTRAIVMWDNISASRQWLRESIPSLLHGIDHNGDISVLNICGRINIPNGLRDQDIDVDGILQSRAFAITGAATAIALRYAGTFDPDAISIILAISESFEAALRNPDHNTHLLWVYMTCMCSTALSLSVVAAGSGDLNIFRTLRRLRKVCPPTLSNSRYGFHLAIHLAIGFLFLGGGCLTFGTSAEAIFGLLCAVYPHFPIDADDNRYHLQAFRHLYVLAVEPRCIDTRDVDTGNSCAVDIRLKMRSGNIVPMRAPCIIPDANTVKEIFVASERYLPRCVQVNPPTPGLGWFSHTDHQVVYVKRRVGHLPHESDPKGSRSIFATSLPYRSSGISLERCADAVQRDLASLYGADPDVLSFDKLFCSTTNVESRKRCQQALQECLVEDKTGSLYDFVDVWRIAALLRRGCVDPVSIASLRILRAYIGFDPSSEKSLLRPSLVASLLRQAGTDCLSDDDGNTNSVLATLSY